MKCPKCRKTKSFVVDSRPAKDKFSISRRRECLACSTRFTTFEATEKEFLSVMIRKNTGSGVTLNSLKAMLNFMSNTLSTLSEETEGLVDKVTQLEMIEPRNKPKKKSDKMPKKAAGKKSKSTKKSATKKKAVRKKSRFRKKVSERKKVAGKKTGMTATDTIFKIISRFKRGVDIPKLKDRTGFDGGKIRNILYQLSNQGKIKKISRGVYTLP
jgi:transcriptional repressor NrdR